ALRPIGKPAPPRPRRFAACSSAISSSGVSLRAFPTCAYRFPSGARSISLAGTDRLHDAGDVVGGDVLPVAVVDGDDGGVAAAAEALDGAEGDLAVRGGLAGTHAELALECLDDALRADERAGEVRADLDEVLAHRGEVVHVVEGRDRVAVRRRQAEGVR